MTRQNALTVIHYYLHHYSVPRALRTPAFEALLVLLAQCIEDCLSRASSDAAVYAAADSFHARVQCVAEQFLAQLSVLTKSRKRKSTAISTTAGDSSKAGGSSSSAPTDGIDAMQTEATGMSNVILLAHTLQSTLLSSIVLSVLYVSAYIILAISLLQLFAVSTFCSIDSMSCVLHHANNSNIYTDCCYLILLALLRRCYCHGCSCNCSYY
jgi:hypothetical protein